MRDIDTFQDNFPADGTYFGVVRADMANDILPGGSPGIQPGDSSVVTVADATFGLADDAVLGGKAVYCYLAVWPQGQATKTGAGVSGGPRWPYAGSETIGGVTWTKLRFDQSDLGGGPVPDNFCVDLNDNLFTPGDTIFFFYSAKSNDGPGTTTYYSLEFGATSDITVAATLPMEFTCLPAGGYNRGGDCLYVDGADGTTSQAYWDLAWRSMHALEFIDRYDIRGTDGTANNGLASRVSDVAAQLNACYNLIYWESDVSGAAPSDGSGGTQKCDDYALLGTFASNFFGNGTILLFGDDVAEKLAASTSPSAVAFKTSYMPFTLVSGDHDPPFPPAPPVLHWPTRSFTDDFTLAGGHDYDVIQATGTSLLQMTYGPSGVSNGAVIANHNGYAAVLMTGFSLAAVHDDDTNGISDRAQFLNRAGRINGAGPLGVTGVRSTVVARLDQNVPNPFNPQTTIAFSLTARAHVRLDVFDVTGRMVKRLVDGTRPAGVQSVVWDGRDAAGHDVTSGVYFYRLTTPGFTQTKKMVLLK